MLIDEIKEDSYGGMKRLQFLKSVIEKQQPTIVLDYGCGIGTSVAGPLAEYFPNIQFLGVDTDIATLEYARNYNMFPNLTFVELKGIELYKKFDLIIASEVIEHVAKPDQFLLFLKEKLTDNGKIVLTLPNGYGPFEWTALAEVLLYLSGIHKLFKSIKSVFKNSSKPKIQNVKNINTLAITPHLNFFSYKEFTHLIENVGLDQKEYKPRTFLCGAGFNQLLYGYPLILWNAKIADYLPPCFSSDWMFLVEKRNEVQTKDYCYRQGYYARLRRYLNEKYVERRFGNQIS